MMAISGLVLPFACLPRSKQNFSAGICYQERLLERILQECTHRWSGGVVVLSSSVYKW